MVSVATRATLTAVCLCNAGRTAVVCRASLEKKAAAAFSAVASVMVASPALALVISRPDRVLLPWAAGKRTR